jgi:hypothetical protein
MIALTQVELAVHEDPAPLRKEKELNKGTRFMSSDSKVTNHSPNVILKYAFATNKKIINSQGYGAFFSSSWQSKLTLVNCLNLSEIQKAHNLQCELRTQDKCHQVDHKTLPIHNRVLVRCECRSQCTTSLTKDLRNSSNFLVSWSKGSYYRSLSIWQSYSNMRCLQCSTIIATWSVKFVARLTCISTPLWLTVLSQ